MIEVGPTALGLGERFLDFGFKIFKEFIIFKPSKVNEQVIFGRIFSRQPIYTTKYGGQTRDPPQGVRYDPPSSSSLFLSSSS